jgi:glycosyltransferase involved in cell wall biosynthesis
MLDPWALSEKSWKKKAALAMGYRAMVTRATALHAHSPYEAQCLREGGLNPRVEVIPHGVFMDEFKPAPRPGSFYNAHPELQGQPYILFLARLHEVKGLDLLADAFASILTDLPTIRLVIAGPDFGARASLIEQSKRLGKAVAYADAACFCLPSKHESFGMSVAEAMACGVPVVVTESCHFPDVTRVGAGREVKRDAASIATALREVLSSPALRAGMARAGRELIMNTYTWERVAQRSAELYAELLAGSRGERAAARAGVRPAETTT